MNLPSVHELIDTMTSNLKQHIQSKGIDNLCMVGIHTGGVWIAEQLHKNLQLEDPLGVLDITFYRDDFTKKGLHPSVIPSELPFSIEERHVILVDDVIMSGRTVRAALNELFDYGRPASITLASLIELDARELPIRADIVGASLALSNNDRIKLLGPAPLSLEIQTTDS